MKNDVIYFDQSVILLMARNNGFSKTGLTRTVRTYSICSDKIYPL